MMTRIIRAEEFEPVYEASKLVATLERRAENLEEERHSALEAARLEGFEAGRRDGFALLAAHLGEALAKAERDLNDLEDRVASVVFQAIGTILSDFTPQERYRKMVAKALQAEAVSSGATIRVCAEDEAMVREALTEAHPNIALLTDKYMAPGELVLETGGARKQIGLTDQLARLVEAINRG